MDGMQHAWVGANLYGFGVPVKVIQAILRHSDVNVTCGHA